MNDIIAQPAPNKLVPVLIGAMAMTATIVIPIVNLVNCLCCAGLMGGAILGVWFYKKNFPPDMPFTIGNGTLVGTLSGLIAGGLAGLVTSLEMGVFSSGFAENFDLRMQESMHQMEGIGQDPATAEQVRQAMEIFTRTPLLLLLILFLCSVLVCTGFGALGGLIGGNIFKTRLVQIPPQAPPPPVS